MAAECAEEEKDEEGNCPVGQKIPKITPEEEIFATTYYEFPEILQPILKNQKNSYKYHLAYQLNTMNRLWLMLIVIN